MPREYFLYGLHVCTAARQGKKVILFVKWWQLHKAIPAGWLPVKVPAINSDT